MLNSQEELMKFPALNWLFLTVVFLKNGFWKCRNLEGNCQNNQAINNDEIFPVSTEIEVYRIMLKTGHAAPLMEDYWK